MKVQQVDSSEWVAGVNLPSLTCKFSQGNKIKSDHMNNIMIQSSDGGFVIHHQIKTCDRWVTGVGFKKVAMKKLR